jgi:hypothetical protein
MAGWSKSSSACKAKSVMRRADTMVDLLAAVLRGSLSRSEEAILYAAVDAAVIGPGTPDSADDEAFGALRAVDRPPLTQLRGGVARRPLVRFVRFGEKMVEERVTELARTT